MLRSQSVGRGGLVTPVAARDLASGLRVADCSDPDSRDAASLADLASDGVAVDMSHPGFVPDETGS